MPGNHLQIKWKELEFKKTSLLVAELESKNQKMLMDHQAQLARAELAFKSKVHEEQLTATRRLKQQELDVMKMREDGTLIVKIANRLMQDGMKCGDALSNAKTYVQRLRPERWQQPQQLRQ